MAVSSANGDGKEFSFMFRGSSCQGNFGGGVEELHDLNHNFAVNNIPYSYKFSRDVYFADVTNSAFSRRHSIISMLREDLIWTTRYPRKQRNIRPSKICTSTVVVELIQ